MKTVRLIYTSKVSGEPQWTEMRDIIKESVGNNSELDITGLLMICNDTYLQVLEGPERAVNELYARILRDKRHHDCILISYEQVQTKKFAGWAMNCINPEILPDEFKKRLMKEFGDSTGSIKVPDDPKGALSLLEEVYRHSLG